jgi:hypothetical protein
MTKLDLQKELLEKVKLGVKPSDFKKKAKNINGEKDFNPNIFLNSPSRQENNTPASSPPVSPIIIPIDKKSQPNHRPESILPPPIVQEENQQIKQLQEQVNFHANTAQTHLTNLQATMAQLDSAELTIKDLTRENKSLRENISQLESQSKITGEIQPEIKTFFCSDCQQNQPQSELSRQFNNFSFCRTCSQKARRTAQEKPSSEPKPQLFTCVACEKEKTEMPNYMKVDISYKTHLIKGKEYPVCASCSIHVKEFNEADLITDEL